MKKRILLICALAGLTTSVYAQRWEPASQKVSEIRKEVEVKYSYRVDLTSLRNSLKDAVETGNGAKPVIISLPTAEGKIEKFAVYSNPVAVKSLADRYQLGSYVGVGVDDPSKYLRFSTSPTEMQSMIIKDGVFQFIEPISNDKQTYGVFYKTKKTSSDNGFECSTEEKNFKDIKALTQNGKNNLSGVSITNRPSITKYRTYRLALATTGEYGKKFDPVSGNTNTVIQMNATMTRVNGVFEKEFGIQLIIQDLPNIISTNPDTDFYTPPVLQTDPSLNLQLQRMLTQQVGNDNYDIGHVFNAAGGNGNAGGIGIICTNPANNNSLAKGAAFTQNTNPTGDLFDIDYVAHEMGHQLGGNHTFSNTSEGSGVNIEPGGGTTIMAYAGITNDNVQQNSDAYFHYSSIDQILTNLDSKTNCGTSQDIATSVNTPPTIAALSNYNIPKGTAYYLDASATDAQNDPMTYTWEQYDSVDDFASISGDSGWGYNDQGSIARSFFGTTSGRRYFPSFEHVIAGRLTNKPTWETVSYIPRTLHYAVTVRDQNAQRPMLSSAENTVTVGNDGPFKFNGLTASSVLYNNAQNTIYWEVANTNVAPYNVSAVKIDYTTNDGATWTDLVASTPNTGSFAVQMPSGVTGAVKLRISAINNIFYAVSTAVNVGAAPTSTTDAPTGVSTIDTEVLKNSARLSWNNVPGATYAINYRKVGETTWLNATSSTNNYLLANLEDEANYEARVAAVVNSVPGTYSSNYTFKTKGLRTGVDYCNLNTGYSYVGAIGRVVVSNVDYVDATLRAYKDVSENTSNIINLVKGTSYPLTVYSLFTQSAPVRYTVWIDYNRNGQFETTERVYTSANISPNSNGIGIGTTNFTVPANAYAGDKTLRMRVASNYAANLTSACGQLPSGAGGIMDFTVKISESTLATTEVKANQSEISIYPNPADEFIGIKNIKGKADYKIYSADGRLVLQGSLDTQLINVSSLTKGVYVITVKNAEKTFNSKFIKK
ncbi:reprolysin-like metallopeptidase [Chryseobacterium sp.]|uniref:reprolysin-like metallopeptidase n=1 Tax=Chryseobacterium sp. TaxID=1871047 RepID=UPI00289B9CE2|nr:M12 family metallo-peptidase [Chryseobacterium sp.]